MKTLENGEISRAEALEAGELTVRIEDYGFTGEGFLRLSDGWLSVHGALPGERVTVRLQEGQHLRMRRLYADVVAVHTASSHRRDPLCERAGVCRGCQLRHLTVDEELRFKVRTVREVLEKFARVDQEATPSIEVVTPPMTARGDAFRIRTSLTYAVDEAGHPVLGLYSPVLRSLLPMEACPALTGPVQRLIGTISEDLPRSANLQGVSIVAPNHGVGLVECRLNEDDDVLEEWLEGVVKRLPQGVGLSIKTPEARRIMKGPERIAIPMGRWSIEVGYEDWCHASIEPAEAVYARLMEWLVPGPQERALDVGCGTGTISLMLSQRAREVVGLDANRFSVAVAEHNAMLNDRGNVHFVTGGWEKGLRGLMMKGERFDVATINPMREPLGEKPLVLLQSLGVRRIVYLGPSPEAASRDLSVLLGRGWTLKRAAAANLHPATYHTFLMALVEAPEANEEDRK